MLKFIKQLNSSTPIQVNEEDGGAIGAGGIATTGMPLFASLVKRTIPKNPRVIKYSEKNKINHSPKKKKTLGVRETYYQLVEDLATQGANQSFDASGAIARLKALEDKESVDYRDTATFGLVDNNGNIIRVTVPTDQSQGFEQDIQHFLGNRDETEVGPEIAEILFKMKDRYTIVNVEWPAVEEDQEENQELEGMPNEENEPSVDNEIMPDDETTQPVGNEDTGQVQTLLTQVIDMMKADADARKAEAQARESEAKTRQAIAARDQAMARVKQEEQLLDMDDYNKSQKNKEKEAKRLAQLARWKHSMDKGEGELPAQEPQYDFLPGEDDQQFLQQGSRSEENEERFNRPQQLRSQPNYTSQVMRGKVSSSDIAKYITQRIR